MVATQNKCTRPGFGGGSTGVTRPICDCKLKNGRKCARRRWVIEIGQGLTARVHSAPLTGCILHDREGYDKALASVTDGQTLRFQDDFRRWLKLQHPETGR